MYEKIYHIHNPLTGDKDWVSEREFQIGSQRLKDVFGVLYLDDVKSMLRFNSQFKEAVMKEQQLSDESELSIEHVCRPISKAEWLEFLEKEKEEGEEEAEDYPARVELKDGYFFWDHETGTYKDAALVQ